MNKTVILLLLLISLNAQAVSYDSYEINNTLNEPALINLTQAYSQRYFTSEQPARVIDELLKADLSPLQRESILHTLLTEISQQPPQAYHQYFVDLMKTHQIKATKAALEGHFPVAIFNLNSKAHGIENIWTAYRTEQQYNQLFKTDNSQAVTAIKAVLAQDSTQRRPQWLGIKNSLAAMKTSQLNQLADYLTVQIKINSGLDQLISHVGLLAGNIELINKALGSEQTTIRQDTLRKLAQHLPQEQAKNILLAAATGEQDARFSIALLGQYLSDPSIQDFILTQLRHKHTADTAAFALSQSNQLGLAEQLKRQFMQSADETEKNHIILALKLNPASSAQLALDDIKSYIETESNASQWLKSFDSRQPGESQ